MKLFPSTSARCSRHSTQEKSVTVSPILHADRKPMSSNTRTVKKTLHQKPPIFLRYSNNKEIDIVSIAQFSLKQNN